MSTIINGLSDRIGRITHDFTDDQKMMYNVGGALNGMKSERNRRVIKCILDDGNEPKHYTEVHKVVGSIESRIPMALTSLQAAYGLLESKLYQVDIPIMDEFLGIGTEKPVSLLKFRVKDEYVEPLTKILIDGLV